MNLYVHVYSQQVKSYLLLNLNVRFLSFNLGWHTGIETFCSALIECGIAQKFDGGKSTNLTNS